MDEIDKMSQKTMARTVHCGQRVMLENFLFPLILQSIMMRRLNPGIQIRCRKLRQNTQNPKICKMQK